MLTDKQKQDRLRFQQTLEALKARGIAVPGSADAAATTLAAASGADASASASASASAPDAAAKKARPKYEKLKKRPQGQSAAGAGGAQEADAAPAHTADDTEQAPPEGQTPGASDAPKDDGIVETWDQHSIIYELHYFICIVS